MRELSDLDKELLLSEMYRKSLRLSHFKSKRGIGRSLILGLGLGSVGRYVGMRAAENADDESNGNISEYELLKIASNKGGNIGALAGFTGGAGRSLIKSYRDDKDLSGAAIDALKWGTIKGGFGYIGGRLGAKKAIKEKLDARRQFLRL